MEFKIGSGYKRDDIHSLYFGVPVPKTGTGDWTTGYVKPKGSDDLVIFMNIGVPGRTGHDFPNKYDEERKIITWYGKPNTHSGQPTFRNLLEGKTTPHFFARWDTRNTEFVYLGIGKIIDYNDGFPTTFSNGKPTSCIEINLSCDNSQYILSESGIDKTKSNFAMEKHLEEFIIANWDSIDLGQKYDLNEMEIEGKRKKYRTDTGEIDIFAKSKDGSHYLVIELKKGRASDKVVGQIQRYMGFIKAEIAQGDENVKGLIVALDNDVGLERALSINPEISFARYEVTFELVHDV